LTSRSVCGRLEQRDETGLFFMLKIEAEVKICVLK